MPKWKAIRNASQRRRSRIQRCQLVRRQSGSSTNQMVSSLRLHFKRSILGTKVFLDVETCWITNCFAVGVNVWENKYYGMLWIESTVWPAPCKAVFAISVWMCVYVKVLWLVGRPEKWYISAGQFLPSSLFFFFFFFFQTVYNTFFF